MHGQCLLQQAPKWAVTNQLSGQGKARQQPDSWLVTAHFGARSGAFFYWTRFIWKQCTIWQYHSDLSDQSALEL